MLDANVHFGHQTNKWNPKMHKYIYMIRNGWHILDIRKTIPLIKKALYFIANLKSQNKKILFVATKKQAKNIIYETCNGISECYINNRWLGGTLTNFSTIQKSIYKMQNIEKTINNASETKKNITLLQKTFNKLKKKFGGIQHMTGKPDALFVVDTAYEKNALFEAKQLVIPIIAMIDSNCNPDNITYPIPANDDSIHSITFILNLVKKTILEAEQISKEKSKLN